MTEKLGLESAHTDQMNADFEIFDDLQSPTDPKTDTIPKRSMKQSWSTHSPLPICAIIATWHE